VLFAKSDERMQERELKMFRFTCCNLVDCLKKKQKTIIETNQAFQGYTHKTSYEASKIATDM